MSKELKGIERSEILPLKKKDVLPGLSLEDQEKTKRILGKMGEQAESLRLGIEEMKRTLEHDGSSPLQNGSFIDVAISLLRDELDHLIEIDRKVRSTKKVSAEEKAA